MYTPICTIGTCIYPSRYSTIFSVFKTVNLYFSQNYVKFLCLPFEVEFCLQLSSSFFWKDKNIIFIINFAIKISTFLTKFTNKSIPQYDTSNLHYHVKFVLISFNFVRTCRVTGSSTGFMWLEHCPLVLHDLAGLHTYACFICWGVPLGSGGRFLSIPWGVCIPWGGGCIPGDIPGRIAVKKINNHSEKYDFLYRKSVV